MRICCMMCSRNAEGIVYKCQCPLNLSACHCDRWLYTLHFRWNFYIWGPLAATLSVREVRQTAKALWPMVAG